MGKTVGVSTSHLPAEGTEALLAFRVAGDGVAASRAVFVPQHHQDGDGAAGSLQARGHEAVPQQQDCVPYHPEAGTVRHLLASLQVCISSLLMQHTHQCSFSVQRLMCCQPVLDSSALHSQLRARCADRGAFSVHCSFSVYTDISKFIGGCMLSQAILADVQDRAQGSQAIGGGVLSLLWL